MLRYALGPAVVIALTASVVGCTQCDTCDDFPTPCIGPNCGFMGNPGPPGTYTSPMPTSAVIGTTVPSEAAPMPGVPVQGAGTVVEPGASPGPPIVPEAGPSREPTPGTPPTGTTTPPAPMTPGAPGPFTPPMP